MDLVLAQIEVYGLLLAFAWGNYVCLTVVCRYHQRHGIGTCGESLAALYCVLELELSYIFLHLSGLASLLVSGFVHREPQMLVFSSLMFPSTLHALQ